MTADRSRAYARVAKTVADLGPAKLHDVERRRIRDAADELVFATRQDCAALEALLRIRELAHQLTTSGRWTDERAARLAADVAACGPD